MAAEEVPVSLIEMWGPSVLEVGTEGWKAQGSLGRKMEVGCGAEQGEGLESEQVTMFC